MVLAHAATGFRCNFFSGSSKTWTWKLSATLAPQIRENHKNVSKVGPRRLPKCTLKSIKIKIWPPVCPPGGPLDPRITKMVSQVPKMEPQGFKMTVFSLESDPFQQSTSQQLLADRGPAAGGEALEYIYTLCICIYTNLYIYIYIDLSLSLSLSLSLYIYIYILMCIDL